MEFTAYMDGMKQVSKITAYKEDIRIDPQNKIGLAVSVIFEVIPTNTPSPEFERLKEVAQGAASISFVALGAVTALRIIATAARFGGPLGFGISAIAALILGEIEDMEAEPPA